MLLMEMFEANGVFSISNYIKKTWKEITAVAMQHTFQHARLPNTNTEK